MKRDPPTTFAVAVDAAERGFLSCGFFAPDRMRDAAGRLGIDDQQALRCADSGFHQSNRHRTAHISATDNYVIHPPNLSGFFERPRFDIIWGVARNAGQMPAKCLLKHIKGIAAPQA